MNDNDNTGIVPVPAARTGRSALLVGASTAVLLAVALGAGGWRYNEAHGEVRATAEQRRTAVPRLRTATIQASAPVVPVSLPATTVGFAAISVFARASGYIDKRFVDIGDRVKAGQVLAQIVALELDHQIAQAEATLAQTEATLKQNLANQELARVTWQRNKTLVQQGWVTQQQGDIDRLTLEAREAAVGVARSSIVAQQAQIQVLKQQKAYQSVTAPFDGVITQRNIDVGSLVQADATGGTFMFGMTQSDTIRVQVYVPQDQAFGVAPGVRAVVRVPELPGRSFEGTVTRIADALQPGTRTLLTEIDVPNRDGLIAPGVYSRIELQVPRKTPSVSVPADAVRFDREGLKVAVVEDGVARVRKIGVVRDLGTTLEVNEGVRAGDVVILNPPVDLEDGGKVAPREPATASR